MTKVFAASILLCFSLSWSFGQEPASYGSRQLDQIIADRPELEVPVNSHPGIRRWIVERFDRDRIYWSNSEPGERPSNCRFEYEGYPAIVQVTADKSYSPIDKLVFLIFELHNLENSREVKRLTLFAQAQELDRDEYSLRLTHCEFDTLIKVKQFLRDKIEPGIGHHPWLTRLLNQSEDFDEYLKWLDTDTGYDPREHFGTYYDRLISNSIIPVQP